MTRNDESVRAVGEFAAAFNCNQCGCSAYDHYTEGSKLMCDRCSPTRDRRYPECASIVIEEREFDVVLDG